MQGTTKLLIVGVPVTNSKQSRISLAVSSRSSRRHSGIISLAKRVRISQEEKRRSAACRSRRFIFTHRKKDGEKDSITENSVGWDRPREWVANESLERRENEESAARSETLSEY